MKILLYTPFTGLGLYGGFRGNRWLRNRIKIFKQFVIPSLLKQTDRDFVHWIGWRPEEKNNPYVKELHEWMSQIPDYKFVFTYGGLCFWDDKYEPPVARERLFNSLKDSLGDLIDHIPDCDEVGMMLVPSDDLYDQETVWRFKREFKNHPELQAIGFNKGYICNYHTKEVLEYNPTTNPPFFAIKFPRNVFLDPGKHLNYTGPYISHEYVPIHLKMKHLDYRGFMVGTHGENVSTHFNHPFGGQAVVLGNNFGIQDVPNLELPRSLRKKLLQKLPHSVRRKLRYWEHQRVGNWIYNFLRN